jgi:ATP-dependent DNA ligase
MSRIGFMKLSMTGFRALAVLERGQCRSFSWKKHKLHGFRHLGEGLVKKVNADTAILDGELGVTDHLGRTVFASLMKRQHQGPILRL